MISPESQPAKRGPLSGNSDISKSALNTPSSSQHHEAYRKLDFQHFCYPHPPVLARIPHLEAVVLSRTSGPKPFSTLLAHTYSDKVRHSLELIHYGPESHGLSALGSTALDLAETSTGAFKAQRPLHWMVPLTQDPLPRQGSSKFRMPSDINNTFCVLERLIYIKSRTLLIYINLHECMFSYFQSSYQTHFIYLTTPNLPSWLLFNSALSSTTSRRSTS